MSDVQIRISGACGRITLNRPNALNALTFEMVQAMHLALVEWATADEVKFVLVDGAGERGLCAGGDIRAMYNAMLADRNDLATDFFRAEYQLNYFISRYQKPYAVLMDGLVMGGGIGISAHGSHRIVTERSQLAMPETAIGFIPDVGGTYLLGTAPDDAGTYLGLTGSRIGPADAIEYRLADMMVPSVALPGLVDTLERCKDAAAVELALRSASTTPPTGMTDEQKTWILECFAASTVEDIFELLRQHKNPDANATATVLTKMSPTSLKLTLTALRNARGRNDLATCLQQEYRLAQACLTGHDFVEGVRAALVDKDRNPQWSPSRIEDVQQERVQACFAAPGRNDLELIP